MLQRGTAVTKMAPEIAPAPCMVHQGTKTTLDLQFIEHNFIHTKKIVMGKAAPKGNKRAIKKAIPAKKPGTTTLPIITKYVITTVINGRQQFISHLATTNQGGRFISHWTSNREMAKDFLSDGMAMQYMQMMSDGVALNRLSIEMIDVPFHPTTAAADDGPCYEFETTIHSTKFSNQIPQTT